MSIFSYQSHRQMCCEHLRNLDCAHWNFEKSRLETGHAYTNSETHFKLLICQCRFSAPAIVSVHSTSAHFQRGVRLWHTLNLWRTMWELHAVRQQKWARKILVQATQLIELNNSYCAFGFSAPVKLCWRRHLLPLGAGTVRVCATDGRRIESVHLANVHKPWAKNRHWQIHTILQRVPLLKYACPASRRLYP